MTAPVPPADSALRTGAAREMWAADVGLPIDLLAGETPEPYYRLADAALTVLAAHLGQQQEADAGEAYPGELDDLRQQLERAHTLVRKINREALDAEFAIDRVKALADELDEEGSAQHCLGYMNPSSLSHGAAARIRDALGADL